MTSVLFVDDEPHVLEGLENRLRARRGRWHMRFASGGREALAMMQASPADVVVSDIRMPGMDGVELLQHVRRDYPQTDRIALSGEVGAQRWVQTLAVANLCLSKPCDVLVLQQAVERLDALRCSRRRVDAARTAGAISQLPVDPQLYLALSQQLNCESPDFDRIAAMVAEVPAVCARLLQFANSANFARARPVSELDEAVRLLGLDVVGALVLAAELFEAMPSEAVLGGISISGLQRHAVATARMTASLLDGHRERSTGFAAALLHDLGLFALGAIEPDALREACERSSVEGIPLHEAESAALGYSHADVGAALLGAWGLPFGVVEAVAFHHAPAAAGPASFGAVAAVHVAEALVAADVRHPAAPNTRGAADQCPSVALDLEYLRAAGVEDLVPRWRALAEQIVARGES